MKRGWLHGSYDFEFDRYCSEVSNAFDILDNKVMRDKLVELLSNPENQGGQLNFLWNDSELIKLLEEMREMQKHRIPLYNRFRKQAGQKIRDLAVPKDILREFFDKYLIGFIKKGKVHKKCYGGEKGWSPRKSLETHLPFKTTFSFDFSDAFQNFGINKVFGFYYNLLEDVSEEQRRYMAGFLAKISTIPYENKRALAIGSPHALFLFNRALFPFDSEISDKSEEKGMCYSRWVDDITITSDKVIMMPGEFVGALGLAKKVMPLAPNKTFFQTSFGFDEKSDLVSQFSDSIYLLGQRIYNGKILKNNPQQREQYKLKPLDLKIWHDDESW